MEPTPLKHPEFLKDLILNCCVIAQHVKTIQEKNIEKVIIEAFPLESLLPTSNFIFAELNRLKQISAAFLEDPAQKWYPTRKALDLLQARLAAG